MSKKCVVIYCRYSSDMQRPDSCADQEREVRAALARLGITGKNIVVICDEAQSGTKANREGFQRLCEMIKRGEVAVVAVDTQSRLTRGENAHAFVKDLVYAGGRFIATGENIDTAQNNWEVPVRVKELQNGLEISGLGHMVRRGQQGRVEDDGSAGDHPYGYTSFYLDDDWAEQLARRGPKPKKGLRICEQEAEWVRKVFAWFLAGQSIYAIARELNRLGVPKGRRSTKPGWHHAQIRRMLANEKYTGRWVWGKTTSRRNSQGRRKQVAVPAGQEVVRERPALRIIEQETWEKAAAKLAQLHGTFGHKQGQKRRGPLPNGAASRGPLGGVIVCGKCGAKLWRHANGARTHYACPDAKKGLCDMRTLVPAARAETALADFVLDRLRSQPECVRDAYRLAREALRAAAARVSGERERDAGRAEELKRQVANLVNALADGEPASPNVKQRLREAEAELADVEARLEGYARFDAAKLKLPDEAQVAARVGEWAGRQASAGGPESLLRLAVAAVTAEPVIAPGKTRGYIRLRFRLGAGAVLAAALGEALAATVRALVPALLEGEGPEFTIDLGEPTVMDRWAPQIAAWRAEGVKWSEIVTRSGLDLSRAFITWKRYTGAQDNAPPAE